MWCRVVWEMKKYFVFIFILFTLSCITKNDKKIKLFNDQD